MRGVSKDGCKGAANIGHSGAMRSIEPKMCNCTSGNLVIPGSRYARPGMTRNDEKRIYSPSTIFATISRWISDEPPKMV